MQHTQFFHVWSFFLTRSVHSIYKPLKNELNFVYQLSKFFKECTRFIHSTYTIVKKKMYTILYIQNTQNFKEFTLFCSFNERKLSKNIPNYVHLMYIFKECT